MQAEVRPPPIEVGGWTIIAIERLSVGARVHDSFLHGAGYKELAALILQSEERIDCIDPSGEPTPLDPWLGQVPALASMIRKAAPKGRSAFSDPRYECGA